MEPPFRPRQFVWCQFPYMEEPLRPGPEEHVGYIVEVGRIGSNPHLTVMSLYTTTTPWEPNAPHPLGIVPVETVVANKMNQKGFIMDARKVAFIPVTVDFFPRLSSVDKGIIHTASVRFHDLVLNTLAKLAKRPALIVKLGPDVPNLSRSR